MNFKNKIIKLKQFIKWLTGVHTLKKNEIDSKPVYSTTTLPLYFNRLEKFMAFHEIVILNLLGQIKFCLICF